MGSEIKASKYFVYGSNMLFGRGPGENYEHLMQGDDFYVGEYSTLSEALLAVERELEEADPPKVYRTRYGVGSVSYINLHVFAEAEDGESVPLDEGGTTLTKELQEVCDEAAASYYKWLDYKSEGFSEIADYCQLDFAGHFLYVKVPWWEGEGWYAIKFSGGGQDYGDPEWYEHEEDLAKIVWGAKRQYETEFNRPYAEFMGSGDVACKQA